MTAIQLAVLQKDFEIVKILAPISEAPNAPFPSTHCEERLSPIQWATVLLFDGYSEIVGALAPLVDNPNAPINDHGFTILQKVIHKAVRGDSDKRKEAMHVIRAIVPLVDNPNAPNPKGKTLLEIAKQNEECYNEVFKIVNDSKNLKISRMLNRLRKKRLNK